CGGGSTRFTFGPAAPAGRARRSAATKRKRAQSRPATRREPRGGCIVGLTLPESPRSDRLSSPPHGNPANAQGPDRPLRAHRLASGVFPPRGRARPRRPPRGRDRRGRGRLRARTRPCTPPPPVGRPRDPQEVRPPDRGEGGARGPRQPHRPLRRRQDDPPPPLRAGHRFLLPHPVPRPLVEEAP